jgi:hypothetical protein
MSKLEDFISSVISILRYWVDIHSDRYAWTDLWINENSPSGTALLCKGVIVNDYFSFNWLNQATLEYYEELDDCYDTDGNVISLEDFVDLVIENPFSDIPEDNWYNAILFEGFDTYRNAIKRFTEPVERDIKDALIELDRAKNEEDLLAALVWILHISHINGNLILDYQEEALSTNDVYRILNEIQENGLLSVFSQDDISKWLNRALNAQGG